MIFHQIDEIIRGNKRSTHVPYRRWIALILQYIGTSYGDDQVVDWIHSFTSSNLFNQDPDDDWNITKGMQNWINTPYECEKTYVTPAIISEDEIMVHETYSVSNQHVVDYSQANVKSLSHSYEDVDAANENFDTGSNFAYNNIDMEMVLVIKFN